MANTKILILAIAALTCGAANSAIVLYEFSSAQGGNSSFDAPKVSTSSAAGVTGPADGTALVAGDVGLSRFWNFEFAGFTLSATNGVDLDDATEFATGYFTFTVAATSGNTLNLTSLTFGSAQGGTSGVRGFELYASVDGDGFSLGDTPVLDVISTEDGVVMGTRTTPTPQNVDLSASKYQGIDSITFRYYALTDASGRSVDFTGMTLNGDVIPEPSSLCLFGMGALALVSRRRR